MERLLLVLIFCYSHLLFVVRSSDSGDGLPCAPSAMCTNLDNVSFPFGAAPDCGASPSFLLSSCDTHQAYWDNFKEAIGKGSGTISSPAVMGLSYSYSPGTEMAGNNNGGYGFVNLTWNSNSLDQTREAPYPCSLAHHGNESVYLPDAINLTAFASSAFRFSPLNVYLLFNCTNIASLSQSVKENTPTCQSFQKQCGKRTSCFQLTPIEELKLHDVMETLACAQFMFFVTSLDPSFNVGTWSPGVVQLNWTESQVQFDSKCSNCEKTNGTCGYNVVDGHDKFECFCPGNRNSSTDCEHVDYGRCNGRLCSTASRIGLGVAVSVVAMAILVGLALWCLRRRRSKSSTTRKSKRRTFEASSSYDLDLNGLSERPIQFSYNSLVSATASFSNILGEGGFGVVYEGTLQDSGHMVAVKVLEANRRHTGRQFLNEVGTIGNIHHVNVVRLVGFCVEKSREILVYEFVVNGSLDRWLFKGGGGQLQMQKLDWKQRYAIAVGIARGLCYLHEECRHHIVHCDIKPQNILLDEQMRPKIADFGLAKLMTRGESQVFTLAKGTPGYVAPEFWTGGESQLSTKFDVYSYGMVLLELMSGRRNFVDHCFPAVAFDAAMEGDFKSILDESITKNMDRLTTMEWQQVRTAAFAALWCIQDHPARRPCMSEVVQYLEGVAAISEQPPRPALASNPSLPPSNHNHTTVHNPIALSGGR